MKKLSWRYNGKRHCYEILQNGEVVATAPTDKKRDEAIKALKDILQNYEKHIMNLQLQKQKG